MPYYNTKLADKVRDAFEHLPDVTEKEMFSGICFMVDGKMCVCVSHDQLLCRIGAAEVEKAVELNGISQMMNNGRVMKDYIYVGEEAFLHKKDLTIGLNLHLILTR